MSTSPLTNLPPELLDHIIAHIDSARPIANLGATGKKLRAFVEERAWRTFTAHRFPTLAPNPPLNPALPYSDVARSLTTLSQAWDRRAFVARYIEPSGNIRLLPQNQTTDRWRKPRGQTIGFTPQLDCFEEVVGSSWSARNETLAFSAGAGACIREQTRGKDGGDHVQWIVYRPQGALEGIDDVTSLHLLHPNGREEPSRAALGVIVGTANGNLQLLDLSSNDGNNGVMTRFVTDGRPVRSSSVIQQPNKPRLLAANIGEARVSLYHVDPARPRTAPLDSIDIPRQNGQRTLRGWSSSFLSYDHLAVGLGPSERPIQIYTVHPSGMKKEPLRKLSLSHAAEYKADDISSPDSMKNPTSSIYPIVSLPMATHSMAGSVEGQIFLSGAYDGVIRLHDLRSDRDVEQTYTDPTDESAIYSLLPRGRESLMAGTSRHSLLKVFDLRLGAKAYSYQDAANPRTVDRGKSCDWNLFLKPHSATYPGRGGGNNWARRSAESSVYSLASPSPSSPFIYAGVENAVVELAFMSVLDSHPDPVFGTRFVDGRSNRLASGLRPKEIFDLAMYDQTAEMMKLKTQRSLWETFRVQGSPSNSFIGALPGLDERWKVVSS
ncbi:hypothetical protein BDY17DRAFT_314155 [Neohortaea acidophila]|uniref:F-box domain-containing protein n=1 Tax=Neohortaea acidophila TaxID=245834 RepID=A0A6A6PFH8_9PEZI|nr:uncharacterized protein BDY17DRAFT_314155 [Neohortaea acidophila]KAF2478516.1 hypothetical protein BDY17DRAFT_314155 [Neohortaea acidophila]